MYREVLETPQEMIENLACHCISLEIIVCHEPFVKDKTNLQFNCVEVLDVSACFTGSSEGTVG